MTPTHGKTDGRGKKALSLSLLSILLLSQDRYKYALPPPSAARQKREEDAHTETNSLPNSFPDFRLKMTRPNNPLAPSTSASWLLLATFASTLLAVALLGGGGCSAQTFHYSHGWTNGKRSGDSVVYYKDTCGVRKCKKKNPIVFLKRQGLQPKYVALWYNAVSFFRTMERLAWTIGVSFQ